MSAKLANMLPTILVGRPSDVGPEFENLRTLYEGWSCTDPLILLWLDTPTTHTLQTSKRHAIV